MQGDEAHVLQVDALDDPIHQGVLHLAVAGMAPPEQHVRVVEQLVRQALVGGIQRGGAHQHVLVGGQKVRDGPVDALGIELCHLGHFLFVGVLVPNGDLDHVLLPS